MTTFCRTIRNHGCFVSMFLWGFMFRSLEIVQLPLPSFAELCRALPYLSDRSHCPARPTTSLLLRSPEISWDLLSFHSCLCVICLITLIWCWDCCAMSCLRLGGRMAKQILYTFTSNALGASAPLVLAGHTSTFAAYCIDCMLPRGHWWLRGPSLQHCRYCLSPRLSQTAGRSMQFWWHMMAIKKVSMSL